MLIIKGLTTKHSKKLLNINCFRAHINVKIDIDWEGSLNEGQFGISSDYREIQN